jgi:tRNA 2-thiouridine synthesizing protein A
MIHTLDTRVLHCPLPLLKLQRLAKSLDDGATIELLCRDPATQSDVQAWCAVHGHHVQEIRTILPNPGEPFPQEEDYVMKIQLTQKE